MRLPSPHIFVRSHLVGDGDPAQLHDGRVRERIAAALWNGSPVDATPFGEIFENLQLLPLPAPPQRQVGVRASNLLRTGQLNTWHELAAATPGRLRAQPGLGRTTFFEIVDLIIVEWVTAPPPPRAHLGVSIGVAEDLQDIQPVAYADLRITRPVVDAIADVMQWLWIQRGSETVEQALDDLAAVSTDDLPPDLAASLSDIAATRLDSALALPVFTTDDWLWLLDFDERTLQVLERRVYAEKKLTLEQLAGTMGVTRERVRQLERRATDEIAARSEQDRASGLHHLAARLRRSARHLLRPTEFETIMGALLDESGAPEHQRSLCSAMLRRVAGDWVVWEGHMASTELAHAISTTTERWQAAGPSAAIPGDELDHLLSELGVTEPSSELLTQLGINMIESVAVWWGRRHGDRAVAVLVATNRVMDFTELYAAVGDSKSPRSMQNALLADARMMRRGKDTWGLRSWGGEEYTGLFDELEQAIARAGGRASLADLVDQFVTEFGVKARSVLSYATDRRFIKHPDGTIAMRSAGDPEVEFAYIPIEQTAGAYRVDGVWHVCLEIDDDALRGSGRQLRRGIGQEAGLEPDLTFAIIYDAGTVVFTWPGSQPHIGSVRELTSHHGCAPGDLLLLPLAGPEPRPSRVVRQTDKSRWGGIARVAAEMGLDPTEIDEDEQPLEVSDAVGLPPGADWHDIADRIRDRNDRRIAAFLPEHLR